MDTATANTAHNNGAAHGSTAKSKSKRKVANRKSGRKVERTVASKPESVAQRILALARVKTDLAVDWLRSLGKRVKVVFDRELKQAWKDAAVAAGVASDTLKRATWHLVQFGTSTFAFAGSTVLLLGAGLGIIAVYTAPAAVLAAGALALMYVFGGRSLATYVAMRVFRHPIHAAAMLR